MRLRQCSAEQALLQRDARRSAREAVHWRRSLGAGIAGFCLNTLLLPSARPPLLRAEEQDKLNRATPSGSAQGLGKLGPIRHSSAFGIKPASSTASIPAPGVPVFSCDCRITPPPHPRTAAVEMEAAESGSYRGLTPLHGTVTGGVRNACQGQPIVDFEPADARELIGWRWRRLFNKSRSIACSHLNKGSLCPHKIFNATLHGAG